MAESLIIDASAMVDLLVGSELAGAVASRIRGNQLHAPAHFDAEVLSALGRLHRAGALTPAQVTAIVDSVVAAPITRHSLPSLLAGAWRMRDNLRLVDALYIELANQLNAPVATTDGGLASASSRAEMVGQ